MTSETAAAPARFDAVLVRARHWSRVATGVRPAYVLGALVAVQWIAVLALALKVRHNGWLYYAGGDQLWHYSGAYLMAHGHLPRTLVGYGWSILLLPISAFAGPSLVSALPALVLFNTVVLLPVALLCIYGIAARIAGRLFGYFAAALWVALPYLGILAVQPGYHQKYTELTLPQALGLASVPDFPSTVGLIVAAYLALRATEGASWHAAAGGGLAAGYAIAIKPSNALFLVAPAVLLLAVRWRQAVPFAAGLAPALLTLALWKYRGLGEIAAAPAEPTRLALGGGLLDRIHRPELNSWGHLHQVVLGLREHFWPARVIEWLPLAGCTALLLRSLRGFLLVGTWFIAYLLVKGTYVLASIDAACACAASTRDRGAAAAAHGRRGGRGSPVRRRPARSHRRDPAPPRRREAGARARPQPHPGVDEHRRSRRRRRERGPDLVATAEVAWRLALLPHLPRTHARRPLRRQAQRLG